MTEDIEVTERDLPPWVANALRAIQEAAQAAAQEHWRAGRPIYIWRDEQVMALYEDGTCIPAEEVQREEGQEKKSH